MCFINSYHPSPPRTARFAHFTLATPGYLIDIILGFCVSQRCSAPVNLLNSLLNSTRNRPASEVLCTSCRFSLSYQGLLLNSPLWAAPSNVYGFRVGESAEDSTGFGGCLDSLCQRLLGSHCGSLPLDLDRASAQKRLMSRETLRGRRRVALDSAHPVPGRTVL